VSDIKEYKLKCLFHEHDVLSRFVEQEVVATAMARTIAAGAWIVGMALAMSAELSAVVVLLIAFPGIWAAWFVDVYFSYVGVIYKVRRLEVRGKLAALPDASDEEVSGWATPVNPFDAGDKKSALSDALKSPWVAGPYFLLEVATIALLIFG
jgi:hypothetical protein